MVGGVLLHAVSRVEELRRVPLRCCVDPINKLRAGFHLAGQHCSRSPMASAGQGTDCRGLSLSALYRSARLLVRPVRVARRPTYVYTRGARIVCAATRACGEVLKICSPLARVGIFDRIGIHRGARILLYSAVPRVQNQAPG